MNIAYVTNFFPPVQTGTAQYAVGLAQAMSKLGHNVIVVCPSTNGWKFSESKIEKVTCYTIPAIKLPKCGPLMGFDDFYVTGGFVCEKRILEILRTNKIDILHQCGHLLDLTQLVPKWAKKLSVPCVCSVHTKIYHPNKVINKAFEWVDDLLVGPVMRKYNRVIALDTEIAEYAIDRYRRLPAMLPYGVSPVAGFKRWDDGHEHFQITSVGHVTMMRNREDLLQACDELIDEGLDIRVSIIGKVCYQSKKVYKHADRFNFAGELYRVGVLHEWETSDLEAHWLTMPGIGTAILETMSCGVPCLTYGYDNILGCRKLVEGTNILFTIPRNVQDIKRAIRLVYNNRDLGRLIGQNGKDLVTQELTWDKIAPEYVRLYQEVCRAS